MPRISLLVGVLYESVFKDQLKKLSPCKEKNQQVVTNIFVINETKIRTPTYTILFILCSENEHLVCDEKRDLRSSSFVLSLTVLSPSFAKFIWPLPLVFLWQAAQLFGQLKAMIVL